MPATEPKTFDAAMSAFIEDCRQAMLAYSRADTYGWTSYIGQGGPDKGKAFFEFFKQKSEAVHASAGTALTWMGKEPKS